MKHRKLLAMAVCAIMAVSGVFAQSSTTCINAEAKGAASSTANVNLEFKYVSDKYINGKKKFREVKIKYENRSNKPIMLGVSAFYSYDTGAEGGFVDLKGKGKEPVKLGAGDSKTLTYRELLVDSVTEDWFYRSYIMEKDSTILDISIPIKWNGHLYEASFNRKGKLKKCTLMEGEGDEGRKSYISMIENVYVGKTYSGENHL